ncbi:DUF2920 family protein [Clostridium sp. Cult1]|uniref:DUF2920 family protein n=1 Tax=Clostridium sp. Cult1 TaxID=2079002 RepID=UPI001F460378|nr:DUF2920 family protein [Clostridium sp. Cult1]MCF6463990.1 hypothetical protein [Clostridium sp. Cult1]
MAKEYDFSMYGYPSIYKNMERKLHVYFTEPERGINENTGILLLIPGFGGNSQSNVYKKMRNVFADKHNLVVVQCDYFGWEFMQKPNNITLNISKDSLLQIFTAKEVNYIFKDNNYFERLIEICGKYGFSITCDEKLNEDLSNFNDMGLMQAIDNVTAVITVIEIIKDNNYKFDEGKIIAYGHSHGAYLAYLCNAFTKDLFTLIIDNSAWLFPAYLKSDRYVNTYYNNVLITTKYSYLAKDIDYDEEILNLEFLYQNFENRCTIVCYHGTDDNLISNIDKEKFGKNINCFIYREVSFDKVDGEIFKNTNHGLGSDHLKLFDYTMEKYKFNFDNGKTLELDTVEYNTNIRRYCIDYINKVPRLKIANISV